MIVIVPCCGESQRYNGTKKQFLKLPNGLPLPIFSQSGLTNVEKVVYTFLEADFLHYYENNSLWHGDICLLQKPTASQVDTVVQTIKKLSLRNDAIYVKDCDNYFQAIASCNTVTIKSIYNSTFKLHNKSYTVFNDKGRITQIAEREDISKYINVGGYGFANGALFLKHSSGNTHISDVINQAIKAGSRFSVNYCEKYIDYGEQDDYDKFIKSMQA